DAVGIPAAEAAAGAEINKGLVARGRVHVPRINGVAAVIGARPGLVYGNEGGKGVAEPRNSFLHHFPGEHIVPGSGRRRGREGEGGIGPGSYRRGGQSDAVETPGGVILR